MMKFGRLTTRTLGAMLALMLVSGSILAQDDSKESLYPNTTREEPELDIRKQAVSDKLNEGLSAVNAGDTAKARSILEPFADGSASDSQYAQALALQGLASLSYQQDKLDDAIRQLNSALEIGVLPNDTYFQLMYQLAQFYLVNGQFEETLSTVQKWRAQGKKETADSYALEGKAWYRLQKYPEAIAAIKKAQSMTDEAQPSWDQVLAASYAESGQTDQAVAIAEKQLAQNPGDVTTQRNAVNMLINTQQYAKAIQLMEEAQSRGLMVEAKDYLNLAKLHMVLGQGADDPEPHTKQTLAVLEAGLAKGVLEPGYDVLMLQGDAEYLSGDAKGALATYAKAAKSAPDGEADMRRARILYNQANYSASRTATKTAIDKGVERMGPAYMLLATVERALENKSAAIAAMRKAADYPDTKAKAEKWLREAGA